MKIFECVPNISEGRDLGVVEACADAIRESGAALAHRTSDAAHHRSVFTFFGTRERVLDAAVALARVARDRIDLRTHAGVHPRIGALDVLPFVPFGDATPDDAVEIAHAAAARLWDELSIPSYFYDEASRHESNGDRSVRRTLPDVRRGNFEGLAVRTDAPDTGAGFHSSAGAVAIGARGLLVAFNIVLASDDLALAKRIASCIRERDGGLRSLRALGLRQGDGRVQVSCNLTNVAATPIALVVDLVRELASRSGVVVAGTETIGLIPRAALESVVCNAFGIGNLKVRES